MSSKEKRRKNEIYQSVKAGSEGGGGESGNGEQKSERDKEGAKRKTTRAGKKEIKKSEREEE